MARKTGRKMPKYLIIITGNTLSGEPVSVTAHADHISMGEGLFCYTEDICSRKGGWHDIIFNDYFNLNILWQSDGFCGHLAYVKVSKGEKK